MSVLQICLLEMHNQKIRSSKILLKLLPFAILLAGCESLKTMNAANNAARVSVASWNAQAIIQAEQARTQAAIGVAQASAMADVSINAMWAAQVPWIIVTVCLTTIILAILYWRGRISIEHQEQPSVKVLPPPSQYKAIQDFAQAHGGQIVWTPDGKPLLQSGDGRRRQLRITTKNG